MSGRIFSLDNLRSYLDMLEDSVDVTLTWRSRSVKLCNPTVSVEMVYESDRTTFGALVCDISGCLTSSKFESLDPPRQRQRVHVIVEDHRRAVAFEMLVENSDKKGQTKTVDLYGYVVPLANADQDFICLKK